MKEVVWSGAVIIHPNTDKYRMVMGVLTYQSFCSIPISKEVSKLKYLIDKDLYAPIVKLTHAKGLEAPS
jgi:hypothetical protein